MSTLTYLLIFLLVAAALILIFACVYAANKSDESEASLYLKGLENIDTERKPTTPSKYEEKFKPSPSKTKSSTTPSYSAKNTESAQFYIYQEQVHKTCKFCESEIPLNEDVCRVCGKHI